jgi:RIO kinase 1
MVRDSREEWKTWQGVFDNFTLRVLFKLQSQGHFDELKNIISPGKEAVVFTAHKGEGFVAVKIYKLETAKFTKMYSYIRVDPRYPQIKNNQRQVIFSWTEREFRNLVLARHAHVTVPMPIAHKDNVLVMEYIGHELPAPLLKASPPDDPEAFCAATLSEILRLAASGMVHGDLSEFNILNLDERPVLIDFSHGVTLKAPNSRELLQRDVENVCRYFASLGVDTDKEAVLKQLSDAARTAERNRR